MRLSVKVAVVGLLVLTSWTPTSTAIAPTAQAQQITPVATSTAPVKDATACNCYAYVKSKIPSLPNTAQLKGNGTPKVGSVVIFDYDGLPHYGIIKSFDADGFMLEDSNYVHCEFLVHYISWSNKAIRGFWDM